MLMKFSPIHSRFHGKNWFCNNKIVASQSVNKRVDQRATKEEASSCWVPHPRTGIYFPKGQEKVMNDVPVGAASFTQTFWLRNEHGVEKPDHDTPPDYYFHTNM